ncbi:MAG TPA: hypothetical protein VMX17_12710 [Candidatus Glassbacteria bacterium]|nr:hypothetical protein [Candidatus Glassbacteria bacterium]
MNKHPNYTLLKVKKHRGMEGEGFNALLALSSDKKVIAEVMDEGSGGPLFIRPTDKVKYAQFVSYVASQSVTYDLGDGRGPVEITTEREGCVIEEILEAFEWQKLIARASKTSIVFRLKEDPNDSYRKVPLKGRAKDELVKAIYKKYPTAEILSQ